MDCGIRAEPHQSTLSRYPMRRYTRARGMRASFFLAVAVTSSLAWDAIAFCVPPSVATLSANQGCSARRPQRWSSTQLTARFMRDGLYAPVDGVGHAADGATLSRKEMLYLIAAGSASLFAPAGADAIESKCQCGKAQCECPVVVIGAAGGTGGEAVRTLLRAKSPVVAATRRPVKIVGRDKLDPKAKGPLSKDSLLIDKFGDQGQVRNAIADALLPETLSPALQGARAVIYCAGSRQKVEVTTTPGTNPGGNPAPPSEKGGVGLKSSSYMQTNLASAPADGSVEDVGLVNVAKECIRLGIPKLVIVSSICAKCQGKTDDDGEQVDRGAASCDTCYRKQDGEKAVRDLYAAAPRELSYTIVRPGLLSYGERRGVGEVEMNQGTSKSGIISRADLAEVVVSAAQSDAAERKTFEVYYSDTAQPVDMYASLQTCKSSGKSVKECFFGKGFDESSPIKLDEVLTKPLQGSLFASGSEVQGAFLFPPVAFISLKLACVLCTLHASLSTLSRAPAACSRRAC